MGYSTNIAEKIILDNYSHSWRAFVTRALLLYFVNL